MTAQFGYLLNAMERAACESNPAEHDYKGKRIAVLGYVSALEVECERLRAELAALQQMYTAQGLTIKRQQDELAECKQDAERYRWLRGTVPESSSRWARWRLECWISGAWHELRGLHLDTCIDAARKGEGDI